MSRLASGGLIDRNQSISFRFDGRQLSGYAGDSLASALIANGVRTVGRSFKYHRRRGILTAGASEPNALVTVGVGARTEPNARATLIELFDGLEARSQNRWPSLGCDLLAMNQLVAPLLVAGFYYKTFMWPAALWEKLYEPLIRRAAGLGKLSGTADPDHYDREHGFCDLLVVGAGPAGLAAALAAARSGARVVVADEDCRAGGALLGERHEIDNVAGHVWASAVAAELASLPNVTLLFRTSLFGVYDGCEYGAIERRTDHLAAADDCEPRHRYWKIVAKRAILATGAIERPFVFGNNDRPGIMMASALGTYANRYAAVPGQSAIIATSSDSGWHVARDLLSQGVEVSAVVEARDAGPAIAADIAAAGVRVVFGTTVEHASGRELKRITVRHGTGAQETLDCDVLGMAGGWNPAIGLASHLGGRPHWLGSKEAFFSGAMPPGMIVVGAANGQLGLGDALVDGLRSGARVAEDLGYRLAATPVPQTSDDSCSARAFWFAPASKAKAFVDFQNDVTASDVRLAAREGFVSVEHMKRYTTLGMATDQGRTSALNGHAVLADALGKAIGDVGTILARPPAQPVAIAALAGPFRGPDFRPVRQTPSFAWAVEHGATFVDAGEWKRARWFARPGEVHWLDTVNREVLGVRSGVGICDVSTLGKIEIAGPDAAGFLDRLYINGFAKLALGKARYGVMLRDDGFVLDDGTTSRFAEDRFFVTTTTANAGRVMQHIDFARQALWPELDVQACSVTEQWATFAVAGPHSRALVQTIFPDFDLSDAAFPYMAAAEWRWRDIPARLFRLSFSGELAYELSVPASQGDRFVRALFEIGEAFDAIPYGTEALGVLRIEKGHAAGPELNGQTTASDLGLGGMMSRKKTFLGRAMAMRPGLVDPARPALIGLRPLDAKAPMAAGAHLFGPRCAITRANDQGYVTSAAYSPHLKHMIALGLLARGRERLGERIVVEDPLRGHRTEAEICAPVFIDPEGARLRG